MNSSLVIEAHGLSKSYRIWKSAPDRLFGPLAAELSAWMPGRVGAKLRERGHAAYQDFYALKDISFELRRGESLGILGRNGAGKSTLLQLLAGTLQPTSGSVRVHGRVAALLELGSGFNPEFTGRENVYLNGHVLGLTKRQIDEKFAEITAFAEIGDFINQPVKTYSSGMLIRLAFAVGISVEPDVLIVDEALSVGDVFFQQKCFARVHEMLAKGVSLLFVSHDTAAVQNLCDQALLLSGGTAIYQGLPEEAVGRYFALGAARRDGAGLSARGSLPPAAADNRDAILRDNILPRARARLGQRELEIVAASVTNERELSTLSVPMRGKLRFKLLLRAHRNICEPNVGIHIFDRMNNLVFAAGTTQLRKRLNDFVAGEERIVTLEVGMSVQPGAYTFSLGCSEPSQDGPNSGYAQDRHEGLGPLEVYHDAHDVWPFYGIAQLPMEAYECSAK